MRDRLWFWSTAVPGNTKLEVRFLTIEHWSLLFSCLDVVLDVIMWVHLLVCHRAELEFSQSGQDWMGLERQGPPEPGTLVPAWRQAAVGPWRVHVLTAAGSLAARPSPVSSSLFTPDFPEQVSA